MDSSRNGTSGMLRHINHGCRYYPPNVDKTQKVIVGDRSHGNKMKTVVYNQEDYLEACVEMIVIDEFSFSFIEEKKRLSKVLYNVLCLMLHLVEN